jgi:hypothetical protein
MNTFEAAREAGEAVMTHVCRDNCPRNSEGYCFTKIALWKARHRAALAWNAPEPPPTVVVRDQGYL